MKKRPMIIATLCVMLVLGYLTYNRMNPHYKQVNGDRNYFQTFDELERTSDVIVRVQATNRTKTHYDIFDEGTPDYGWTTRDVIVDKVYRAPEGFTDNVLKVREPYWAYTNLIGERIVTYLGDYRPMKPNKTYMLFLVKNDDGTYWPNYTDQGKYLIDSKLQETDSVDKYTPDDFETGGEVPNYRDFYREVIKKYQ